MGYEVSGGILGDVTKGTSFLATDGHHDNRKRRDLRAA